MNIALEGLTFDDILLLPDYTEIRREEVDVSTQLTKDIRLTIPLLSSPMDTVTTAPLAIALAQEGGMGIIHRNLSIEKQAEEVKKVKDAKLNVGAAVGTGNDLEERLRALVEVGTDAFVVDSAHGYSKGIIDATVFIKKTYPKVSLISGNVATTEGAQALIDAGADALRVGMGPGSICTTRIISGMGVPQVTAIMETARAAKAAGVPVIADGGIKFSGDILKALAAGASAVMMGSYFASALESPGKVVTLEKQHVPQRFKSILKTDVAEYTFKEYRGMGSVGAMQQGAKIKSEDEFHGKDYKDRVLVAEGVEGLVPVKGTVKDLVDQSIGGIKSGMYYVGVKNIKELHEKAKFMQITQASLTESHPHSVLITNPGENY